MKINSSPKICFGQISSKTIDTIRNHAEGYCYEKTQDRTVESYDLNPKYHLFDTQQLERIKELTARASVMKRSFITQSGIEDGIDVRSRNANNEIKTFLLTPNLEGKNEEIIDILQNAVKYAERIEYNPTNKILFKDKSYSEKGSVRACTRQISDRFRSQEDNNLMQDIYNNTVVIESKNAQNPPKRRRSKKG